MEAKEACTEDTYDVGNKGEFGTRLKSSETREVNLI